MVGSRYLPPRPPGTVELMRLSGEKRDDRKMADDDGPSLTWFYPAGGDGGDGGGGGGGGGTSSAYGSAAVYSCQIRAKKLDTLPNPDVASHDGQDDPGGSALCGILTEKQPGVNSKTTVVVSSLVMMTGTQPVPRWHHIDYEEFYDAWVQKAQIALAIEGHTPIDPPFHSLKRVRGTRGTWIPDRLTG